MTKINWPVYNEIVMPQGLMVGEIKTLTEAEIMDINSRLAEMSKLAKELRGMFKTAKLRFTNDACPACEGVGGYFVDVDRLEKCNVCGGTGEKNG